MTLLLLDRLRQELPGDWKQPTSEANPKCWYHDPRTIMLEIGERHLLVSFRRTGGWCGQIGGGVRLSSWPDLIAGIRAAAARIAIDHARFGSPIPPVPTWATPALTKALSNRHDTLTEREMDYRSRLAAIEAERAILSTLTLGA